MQLSSPQYTSDTLSNLPALYLPLAPFQGRVYPSQLVTPQNQIQNQGEMSRTPLSTLLLFPTTPTSIPHLPGQDGRKPQIGNPRLMLSLMTDTMTMALRQEEISNRGWERITPNEIVLRPLHQEPIVIQVQRKASKISWLYRA